MTRVNRPVVLLAGSSHMTSTESVISRDKVQAASLTEYAAHAGVRRG